MTSTDLFLFNYRVLLQANLANLNCFHGESLYVLSVVLSCIISFAISEFAYNFFFLCFSFVDLLLFDLYCSEDAQ